MKYSLRKNLKKGFTLIELLVVIAIIGLLSTVVLGSLAGARVKAEAAATKAQVAQIRLWLQDYYDAYQVYPYLSGDVVCFGSPCTVAGVEPVTIINSLSLNNDGPKTKNPLENIASIGGGGGGTVITIPTLRASKSITINNLVYSGYAYVSCSNPITSLTQNTLGCSGEGTGDVSIITPVGNDMQQADASTGFILGAYTPSSGGGPTAGCMNPGATNYNPSATSDDGSCSYQSSTGTIYGCTDSSATNYNASANANDGSCYVGGCTNSAASNYNPSATSDDGSCSYGYVTGCTDSSAVNYNSSATSDDGSCSYGS